jgi:hypothetical protein
MQRREVNIRSFLKGTNGFIFVFERTVIFRNHRWFHTQNKTSLEIQKIHVLKFLHHLLMDLLNETSNRL